LREDRKEQREGISVLGEDMASSRDVVSVWWD
jgi:hypothetical protein